MHDTAFTIGGLVIGHYCPPKGGRILEIGSLDVNGSLRHHRPSAERYVGLDFSAGEGVDHVISGVENWPVEDETFDLVIASSVLEHDPFFWTTFVKMIAKTRPGGHVYVNAPSSGWVHRYPLDCWRFYPDSAVALAQWAGSQGYPVQLVESFTVRRENDVWNDWCAVFRREPSKRPLPEVLICERVACTNIICWKSEEILRFEEETEDMKIIAEERGARALAQEQVVRLRSEADRATDREQKLSFQINSLKDKDKDNRALTLLVRRLRGELATATKEVEVTKRDLADQRARSLEEHQKLAAREESMKEDLRSVLREKFERDRQLLRATAELAKAALLLRDTVADRDQIAAQREWLLAVLGAFQSAPVSWLFLPAKQRRKRLTALLRRLGLFDAPAYLRRYPDVAASGMDPLGHYLRHGMGEGRETDDLETRP
jgi:hypothetical protein